ncbi:MULTISPECIES: hypothetical protein [Cytobacillus]|uniref:Uncharacterized protein n=1 Tax=Cytobacillus firmus TaxID=1399 RepID=A0AA46PTK1_CYTFI|nr:MULTISPECIES: hypothetical protein [Cytobacillus]MDF2039355.1 hypothetical protein [Cytobacillus oceanisediminis]UYG96747.1 hypothetical protein OD459_06875 [Cytobacillus firmus]
MAVSLFTNRGTNIDRATMLKADSYEELKEKINTRLGRKYSPSKIKYVWKIQELFNNPDFSVLENGNLEVDYWRLTRELKFTINKKAEWYAYRYRNARLSYQDFEAEFWKITWDAIEYYEQGGDFESFEGAEFTLVETLELFWKNRIIDFIRSCLYTKKHNPWYTAASLSDDFNEYWPDTSLLQDEQLIINETIDELFCDKSLTEDERRLLEIIYDNPTESLREWGEKFGFNHPETVRRRYLSLKRKLSKYSPY